MEGCKRAGEDLSFLHRNKPKGKQNLLDFSFIFLGGHQAKHRHTGKGEDCPALFCTGVASP